MNVDIEEENKMVVLLNLLPDEEYKTFVLTLINGRQSLNYNDVSAALVNYEVRRKDKQFSSNGASAKALMVRGRGSNQKGKCEQEKSKSRPGFRDLKKNQCAFCKEIGHWKVDFSRIKEEGVEDRGKSRTGDQYTQAGTSQVGRSGLDSLVFSFSVTTPTISYSSDSEWVLDTGATYYVCPNKN